MIERHHHLLRLEAELLGDLFERVDRRAVDVRLARLAETPVAHGDAEAFEQALERRRAAIHRRGLHDLGHEPAPRHDAPAGRARKRPTARSTIVAGVTPSTATSTTPGRPCSSGIFGGG